MIIYSDRLLLKPVTADDLQLFTRLLSNAETTRYLPGGKPMEADQILQTVLDRAKHWQKGYGTFSLHLKDNPLVKIGYAGVEQVSGSPYSDIRYALLADHQGKGFALEAAKAVLKFTFDTGLVKTFYGVAVNDNHASIKLLSRLGMTTSHERLYDSDDLVTFSLSV
jgi:ribosomal-protein-alanine N-acetyltransferase